jgi:hypothetical protein
MGWCYVARYSWLSLLPLARAICLMLYRPNSTGLAKLSFCLLYSRQHWVNIGTLPSKSLVIITLNTIQKWIAEFEDKWGLLISANLLLSLCTIDSFYWHCITQTRVVIIGWIRTLVLLDFILFLKMRMILSSWWPTILKFNIKAQILMNDILEFYYYYIKIYLAWKKLNVTEFNKCVRYFQ